jgi:hypothetical protein
MLKKVCVHEAWNSGISTFSKKVSPGHLSLFVCVSGDGPTERRNT